MDVRVHLASIAVRCVRLNVPGLLGLNDGVVMNSSCQFHGNDKLNFNNGASSLTPGTHMSDHNEYDDNAIVNASANLHMNDLLAVRLSRRQALKGGVGVTTTALLGGFSLAACGGSDTTAAATALALGFAAVAKNKNDVVTVPEGYQVSILHSLGDPLEKRWQRNG
jgi:hypothetical protein